MHLIKNIFGTDGVRGLANTGYITPENIMKIAISAANYFNARCGKAKLKVVIGKDTRLSGYMLESALTSGFIAAGADVMLLGPIPTPAVSAITRTLRADLGVVISASHNHYEDNGVKFFDSKGFKLSNEEEIGITNLFFNAADLAEPSKMGKAKRVDDTSGRYLEFVKATFVRTLTLSGLKIVVDSSNGAAYKIAPQVFWELGADVITIGDSPNGLNINQNCGATNTKLLRSTVIENKADIGIALDGDGDRLIIVDDEGCIVDGDYIIATIAADWHRRGKLRRNNVVATNMSNMGLEIFLQSIGVKLERSQVGDKHVVRKMLECGANLGGEKSGHIIPIDYTTTGDGLIAALQVLVYLISNNQKSSYIKNLYISHPQAFKSITKDVDIESKHIMNTIETIEKEILRKNGRIVVRRSGTEDIIRVMVEAEDESCIQKAMEIIDMAM